MLNSFSGTHAAGASAGVRSASTRVATASAGSSAASSAGSSAGSTAARSAPDGSLPRDLAPIRAAEFGFDEARHLLMRAGFGGTPEQIRGLAALGPERAVDFLLDGGSAEPVTADLFNDDIMNPPTPEERVAYARARREQNEDLLAQLRRQRELREARDREQIRVLQRWWLERMISTARPLEEKMTLFWHGHFATSYRTIENSYHMFMQNQLFRANAVGNFGDLLFRIIRDPAMLAYLDNNDSRKGQPNENLAREILELFSLGEGNYTERDIKEGARALTGYTFIDDDFVLDEANHDTNPKTIFGATAAFDGDGFVTQILRQPECSRFIASKLYRFFVKPMPEDRADWPATERAASNDLADTLRRSSYDLRPALRRLFLSRHFYHPLTRLEQIKSPAELVVGLVRSLNTPVRDPLVLLDALDRMGQNIFYPPSVAGWEGGRTWINTSTLFVRQNIANFLLTGKKPVGFDPRSADERFDPGPLLGPLADVDPAAARDPTHVIDFLLRVTLGQSPPAARFALEEFVDGHGGRINNDIITGLLVVITAMPEYQLS